MCVCVCLRRRHRQRERHDRARIHSRSGGEDIPVHPHRLHGPAGAVPRLPSALRPRRPQHQSGDLSGHPGQRAHHSEQSGGLRGHVRPGARRRRPWGPWARLVRPRPGQRSEDPGLLQRRGHAGILHSHAARADHGSHREGRQGPGLHHRRRSGWRRAEGEAGGGLPTMPRAEGGRHPARDQQEEHAGHRPQPDRGAPQQVSTRERSYSAGAKRWAMLVMKKPFLKMMLKWVKWCNWLWYWIPLMWCSEWKQLDQTRVNIYRYIQLYMCFLWLVLCSRVTHTVLSDAANHRHVWTQQPIRGLFTSLYTLLLVIILSRGLWASFTKQGNLAQLAKQRAN